MIPMSPVILQLLMRENSGANICMIVDVRVRVFERRVSSGD